LPQAEALQGPVDGRHGDAHPQLGQFRLDLGQGHVRLTNDHPPQRGLVSQEDRTPMAAELRRQGAARPTHALHQPDRR
jgi:hypothetical protein